MSTRLYLSSL